MAGQLRESLGFEDGDAVYQALIELISDLDDARSRVVMAKLILLLANHIGDAEVVQQAIDAARKESRGP